MISITNNIRKTKSLSTQEYSRENMIFFSKKCWKLNFREKILFSQEYDVLITNVCLHVKLYKKLIVRVPLRSDLTSKQCRGDSLKGRTVGCVLVGSFKATQPLLWAQMTPIRPFSKKIPVKKYRNKSTWKFSEKWFRKKSVWKFKNCREKWFKNL